MKNRTTKRVDRSAPDAQRGDAAAYFQTLDRAYMASAHLHAAFEADPVLRRHPRLRRLYERASDALGRLYQQVGKFAFEADRASRPRPGGNDTTARVRRPTGSSAPRNRNSRRLP